MIKTKTEAFATHHGLDASEANDYRYHYGRTSLPVWSIDGAYYCVTKAGQKPSKHRDGMAWQWQEVPNEFVNKHGYRIWESIGETALP